MNRKIKTPAKGIHFACPTCSCVPTLQTCWSCKFSQIWETSIPCGIENSEAWNWYAQYGNSNGISLECDLNAPPCPGWKKR